MTGKNTSTAISQEMIRLYDEYTHLTLDRRGFMDKLAKLAGGSAAALTIAPMLGASGAAAAMVAPDDARLKTETVTFPGVDGTLSGLLAWPADATGNLPAVLVIHENRGLNPHIQDVVRRVALEGFLALGLDFLSTTGGTPADEDKGREMIRALDMGNAVGNGLAALAYLRAHPASNGNTGTMGFCWGGGMVNQMAVNDPDLKAGVVFYGRSPASEDAGKIKAKLMMHYAGLDDRINEGVPPYEAALKAAGVDYTLHMYPDVNHAFHNDTSAARYNEAAATEAFARTIAFFKANLG